MRNQRVSLAPESRSAGRCAVVFLHHDRSASISWVKNPGCTLTELEIAASEEAIESGGLHERARRSERPL